MAANVILVEAQPRTGDAAQPVTVRLAGGGADRPYFYGGQHWRAGITGLPKSVRSLDFDGVRLGGGGIAAAMQLSWQPASAAALAELAGYYWIDAPVTVRIGPEGDALPAIETSGLVLAAPCENGALQIAVADRATDLKRPLLVDRYAGTGGIEGPAEWKGAIKPRAWGRCCNVRGRLIDKAANIWAFGDPARQWRAFDAVRDRGVAAGSEQLTLLDWQGSADATFAALKAATAPAGGGVLAPSIAAVKWWTRPSGDLYADIRGETDGGYVETAAEIVARLVAARSALAFAAGEVAAAAAARPAPIGLLVGDESTTTATAISDLLSQVSLSWMLVGDAIAFRRWEWSAPVRVARSHRVKRRETLPPIATRRLGWRRNWSPMARGDIAVSVLEGTAAYADGTPLDDLKPAEAGATAGALAGTKVGGRPVADVIDTLDLNGRNVLGAIARVANLQAALDLIATLEGQPIGAFVTAMKTELSDAVKSVAADLNLVFAKNAAGTGGVINGDVVSVEGEGINVRSLRSLLVDVDEHDVSITDMRDILFDSSGATLRSVNLLNLDGAITGTYNTLTGETGDYGIVADTFGLIRPADGKFERVFFYDDDGIPTMPMVRIGKILPATDGTTNLPSIVGASSTVAGGGINNYRTVIETTIVTDGPATIHATATLKNDYADGPKAWAERLLINGQQVFRTYGGQRIDSVALMGGLFLPEKGTYNVRVEFAAEDSSVRVQDRSLFAVAYYGVE